MAISRILSDRLTFIRLYNTTNAKRPADIMRITVIMLSEDIVSLKSEEILL